MKELVGSSQMFVGLLRARDRHGISAYYDENVKCRSCSGFSKLNNRDEAVAFWVKRFDAVDSDVYKCTINLLSESVHVLDENTAIVQMVTQLWFKYKEGRIEEYPMTLTSLFNRNNEDWLCVKTKGIHELTDDLEFSF